MRIQLEGLTWNVESPSFLRSVHWPAVELFFDGNDWWLCDGKGYRKCASREHGAKLLAFCALHTAVDGAS